MQISRATSEFYLNLEEFPGLRSRGLLICCLLCFAPPLASLLFSGIVRGQGLANIPQGTDPDGAAIGTMLAAFVITLVGGYVGFFVSVIFLIGSYFTLHKASLKGPTPTRAD